MQLTAPQGLGMTPRDSFLGARASCQPYGGILRTAFLDCPLWSLQAREEPRSLVCW